VSTEHYVSTIKQLYEHFNTSLTCPGEQEQVSAGGVLSTVTYTCTIRIIG